MPTGAGVGPESAPGCPWSLKTGFVDSAPWPPSVGSPARAAKPYFLRNRKAAASPAATQGRYSLTPPPAAAVPGAAWAAWPGK